MSARDDARKDWESGMKYKDIAEKYRVSESTVKSWASRYWKNNSDKVATNQKKLQPSFNGSEPKGSVSEYDVVKEMAEAVQENTELTEKQKEFCVRYMQNRNATQAYLRVYGCSYASAMVSGCNLLRNAKIQEELRKLREIKNAALGGLCGEDIVELHMRIAFADMTDFVEFKSRKVPVIDRYGKVKHFIHPNTGEEIPIVTVETELMIKDSSQIDGTLLAELSEGKMGINIKLADKTKSLQFLERYFELNPNDRHKREYDNARLALLREKDDIEVEDTTETDRVIYGEDIS